MWSSARWGRKRGGRRTLNCAERSERLAVHLWKRTKRRANFGLFHVFLTVWRFSVTMHWSEDGSGGDRWDEDFLVWKPAWSTPVICFYIVVLQSVSCSEETCCSLALKRQNQQLWAATYSWSVSVNMVVQLQPLFLLFNARMCCNLSISRKNFFCLNLRH